MYTGNSNTKIVISMTRFPKFNSISFAIGVFESEFIPCLSSFIKILLDIIKKFLEIPNNEK